MAFELRFGAPLDPQPASTQGGDGVLDYLSLLVTLIGAIAWPVALVVIVLVFRKQLVKLVARMRAVSGPAGISATFADELEKAREAAEQSPVEPRRESEPLEADDPFLKLAEVYPEAAVMEAYKEVESFLANAMGDNGSLVSPTMIMTVLSNVKVIPYDTLELFQRIRNARNLAVHSSGRLTTGEAIEFREVARSLVDSLRPISPMIRKWAENLVPTVRAANDRRRRKPS